MLPANLRKTPVVFAAPLAGVSDTAYRSIVKRMGADYAFTEMVSSEGLVRENLRTMQMLRRYSGESAVGCQLFGTRPEVIADAAVILQEQGFNSVDLNCGCPVHKIVDKCGGAALLKDMPLLERIISATTAKISIPFSIKIRSGWDAKSLNYLEVGRMAEASGASYICLHARSQEEYFGVSVYWEHIRELKQNLSIPVIGNGGISKAADAVRMIRETGCDGVMVASGSLGNPFIFREIKALLQSETLETSTGSNERLQVCLEHVGKIVEFVGEESGIKRARKLIGWYYRHLTGRSKVPPELFQVCTYAEVESRLNKYAEALHERAA